MIRASTGLEIGFGDLLTHTIDAGGATAWRPATLTQLADHIERIHHSYLKRELPRIEALADALADREGRDHPQLIELAGLFKQFRVELEWHLRKEEMVLFPLLRKLDRMKHPHRFHREWIKNPIKVLVHEHEDAGASLARMRSLIERTGAPLGCGETYRALSDALAVLEQDMRMHVHKENNILFPRAIRFEARRTRAIRRHREPKVSA
ncbi:MAG TPA: hemerythrin domain-containing protein [Tepidisphaeraceae bacterium]|jgi:regulator of cell morphogenesis and NO signaling|nr:hemerythrin domain-containing protein [Tepidisphaeraceae bacterium]